MPIGQHLLSDLIDRVTALREPDRDLDHAIEEWECEFLLRDGYVRGRDGLGWISATPSIQGLERVGPAMDYTGSYDAASYLILSRFPHATLVVTSTQAGCHVVLNPGDGGPTTEGRVATDRTRSNDGVGMAMTLAALKAVSDRIVEEAT